MTITFTVSLEAAAGRTGRGVGIAVVDSGIHAAHPHVREVAGGIAFDDYGAATGDYVDRLGHGTAVAAAIREKAPDATLIAVKVFDTKLATTGRALVEAIGWASRNRAAVINLSLGTENADHEAALKAAVKEAADHGSIVVSPAPQEGTVWLPGALDGVIGVEVDWGIPRDTCEVFLLPDGGLRLRASGFPRPIPGVPPERNFSGPSFAVANASGLIALALEGHRVQSPANLVERLIAISVRQPS